MFKIFIVKNCVKCPNIRTQRTPNSGYAVDYICGRMNKLVAGYVEWDSELPEDEEFPEWCPLHDDVVLDKA